MIFKIFLVRYKTPILSRRFLVDQIGDRFYQVDIRGWKWNN